MNEAILCPSHAKNQTNKSWFLSTSISATQKQSNTTFRSTSRVLFSKSFHFMYITNKGLETEPKSPEVICVWRLCPCLSIIFYNFSEKNHYFNAVWMTLCSFLDPFKRAKLQELKTI